MNPRARWQTALRATRGNAPEILLVALGIFLRLRLAASYRFNWGYDWTSHLENMQYVAAHRALPPLSFTVTAYHPPLFYLAGGWAILHGWDGPRLQMLCVAAGVVRMVAIAYGFRRYLPRDRLARLVALAMAAVLPSSILVDVMLTNEAWNAMFAVLTLLCFPPLLADPPRRRVLPALALMVALTLALLSKVSGLMLVGALACGAAAELYARPGTVKERAWRAAPVALAVAASLALVAPVYARHHAETHKWLPTGYDSPLISPKYSAKALDATPYLDRRSLGYVFGMGLGDLLQKPFWPTLTETHSRFWPVVVASTFGDYWNYRFAGLPRPGEPKARVVGYNLRDNSLPWLRRSVAAGFVVTPITAVAWAACLVATWRRRDFGAIALLVAPALALLGLLHFAITFPWDETGLIKAHYLQFAMAPLSAVFGLAISWLWRRWLLRPVAVLGLVSLAMVALYTWHSLRCWPFT